MPCILAAGGRPYGTPRDAPGPQDDENTTENNPQAALASLPLAYTTADAANFTDPGNASDCLIRRGPSRLLPALGDR